MMEFLELSSGQFIFVPRSVYVIQWKGRPYHCVGTSITRKLYHAARSSSTAICPVSISGIKISAYFSIVFIGFLLLQRCSPGCPVLSFSLLSAALPRYAVLRYGQRTPFRWTGYKRIGQVLRQWHIGS